jgi:hypothetical protein
MILHLKSNSLLLDLLKKLFCNDFFKAEWKTILVTILFGGAIFGWFYHDEIVKSQQKTEEYVMTCMHPGVSFKEYALNTPVQSLKLDGFQKTTDDVLKTEIYKNSDNSIVLNVRSGKLASVEYYFADENAEDTCYKDMKYWTEKYSEVAENLPEGDRTHHIYQGLVLIQDTIPSQQPEPDTDALSEDADEAPSTTTKDVGVIILNP